MRNVILMIDVSGSAEPHRAAVLDEIHNVVAALDEDDQFAVITFAEKVISSTSGFLYSWDVGETMDALETTRWGGGSYLQPAMQEAQMIAQSAKGRVELRIFTDNGIWL